MIKRTKGRLTVCIVLTVLTLGWIWGNSLMPGDVSGGFSGNLLKWIGRIFPFISPESPQSGHMIRKLAHFGEFFVLGGLLFWLGGMCFKKTGQAVIPTLAGGILAAAVDELLQRFVPGRYGCLADVLLDSCGAATGMIVILIGYTIYTKHKK